MERVLPQPNVPKREEMLMVTVLQDLVYAVLSRMNFVYSHYFQMPSQVSWMPPLLFQDCVLHPPKSQSNPFLLLTDLMNVNLQ